MFFLRSTGAPTLGPRLRPQQPVPTPVLVLEVVGAAVALGLLALHLTTLGHGLFTVLLAAVLVTPILVVTFDLDRPIRGLTRIPATPLTDLRASMALPPSACGR
jgi:hypothetical protein